MRRRTLAIALLRMASGGLVLHAQPPAIKQNGIFNSASQTPSALTDASIAQRSRFTIDGVRLGDPALTRVSLKHGETSIVLSLISASELRIEAWMPAGAPLGDAAIEVETPAGPSKPFPIKITASELGLFSANGKGWGPAREDVAGSDESPMVTVRATGFGNARTVRVMVGGRPAEIVTARRGLQRGVDSIRFRIPAGVPKGCYVPVYAQVPGFPRSNVVTMRIGKCAMPDGWPSATETRGRFGIIGTSRAVASFSGGQTTIADEAFGAFYQNQQMVASNRMLLLPPVGTCTAYTGVFDVDLPEFRSVAAVLGRLGDGRTLDAGEQLTIAGAAGTRTVGRSGQRAGLYWSQIGMDDPSGPRNSTLFLNDPQYRFSAPGGADIPAFSASLPGVPVYEWTNQRSFETIHRRDGATFEWRGIPKDAIVLALVGSFDRRSTAGEVCFCAAQPEAGRIHVPAEMLARFPVDSDRERVPLSGACLIVLRLSSGAAPRGLDRIRLASASTIAVQSRIAY